MARSPQEMAASMIANLETKTGKPLADWIVITRASGLEKHGQIVKLLKTEHGITHGFANLIAHESLGSSAVQAKSGDDLVAAQYADAKAGLRPIYDALAHCVATFGTDVELSPKMRYVSLRRAKQFGLIQASTRTRVDLGINLKGEAPTGRLEAAGSWNGMVSHRVRLTDPDQVDNEVIAWLRDAYERA